MPEDKKRLNFQIKETIIDNILISFQEVVSLDRKALKAAFPVTVPVLM